MIVAVPASGPVPGAIATPAQSASAYSEFVDGAPAAGYGGFVGYPGGQLNQPPHAREAEQFPKPPPYEAGGHARGADVAHYPPPYD